MFARLEDNSAKDVPAEQSGLNLSLSHPSRNPALFRGVPPGYCRSVSRSFEPSLQSSLQLSLTVLVRYRSGGIIFSLGWSLPPVLRLHSQAIRLASYAWIDPYAAPFRLGNLLRYQNGPFTLSGYKEPRSRRLVQAGERTHLCGPTNVLDNATLPSLFTA